MAWTKWKPASFRRWLLSRPYRPLVKPPLLGVVLTCVGGNKEEAEIHRNPAADWCFIDDVADGIVTNVYQQKRNWRPIWASKCGEADQVPRRKSIRKTAQTAWLSRFSVAGAEGLEPSARGFGVDVEWRKATWKPPFQAFYSRLFIRPSAFDALLMLWKS